MIDNRQSDERIARLQPSGTAYRYAPLDAIKTSTPASMARESREGPIVAQRGAEGPSCMPDVAVHRVVCPSCGVEYRSNLPQRDPSQRMFYSGAPWRCLPCRTGGAW